MPDIISILASAVYFIITLLFFVWFGATLNSINRHLGKIADHAERQTRILASVANTQARL